MLNINNSTSKVVLTKLHTPSILDLMFLPEHDGFFRVSSKATDKVKADYVEFLQKASKNRLSCSIYYKGQLAGFIMVAGIDNRLVGGLLPAFKRKGIYTEARNAVIRLLHSHGIYNITYSVDPSNKVMLKFSASQYKTKLDDKLAIAHVNPTKPTAFIDLKVKVGNKLSGYKGKLYHISFNKNLPTTLEPRNPDGYSKGG